MTDKLLLALAQSQVRQTVLVRDGLVRDAAEGEDEGHDDAGAVFACGAVDEDRGGWLGVAGEVAQDEGEGPVG